MTVTAHTYEKIPATVDALPYDGTITSAREMLEWIGGLGGSAIMASELSWRHDFGTYWHRDHGFIYLPDGARSLGNPLQRLQDNEIVVSTGRSYALVFPGDYVIRSRSGFYPLRAESFHRAYKVNTVAGE
jgi:hypothetical protein